MPATGEPPAAEQAALRDQCSVFLAGHGRVTAADMLADIPADTATDRYGGGGVAAELETEIAARPAPWTSSPRCGSGGSAWAARCSPSGRMPRRR
jgi:hypothetical protein